MTAPAPGWHPDPTSRHAYRYWDGWQWTDDVSDGRRAGIDPLPDDAPAGVSPRAGGLDERPGAGLGMAAGTGRRAPLALGPGPNESRGSALERYGYEDGYGEPYTGDQRYGYRRHAGDGYEDGYGEPYAGDQRYGSGGSSNGRYAGDAYGDRYRGDRYAGGQRYESGGSGNGDRYAGGQRYESGGSGNGDRYSGEGYGDGRYGGDSHRGDGDGRYGARYGSGGSGNGRYAGDGYA
ncbi:MAG TPA: DUF2510 domain-containing protein, partial [Acidimicrobiales bacterium]